MVEGEVESGEGERSGLLYEGREAVEKRGVAQGTKARNNEGEGEKESIGDGHELGVYGKVFEAGRRGGRLKNEKIAGGG